MSPAESFATPPKTVGGFCNSTIISGPAKSALQSPVSICFMNTPALVYWGDAFWTLIVYYYLRHVGFWQQFIMDSGEPPHSILIL